MKDEESPALTEDRFPPAPRKVTARLGQLMILPFLVVFFMSPLLCATFFLALGSLDDISLRKNGIDAAAQVRDLTTVSGKTTQYRASFAYESGGMSYEQSDWIDRAAYVTLKRGATIPILFDPKDPQHSKVNIGGIARRPQETDVLFFLLLLLLIMLEGIFVVSAVKLFRQYGREKRLLTYGIPVRARILAKEEYQNRNGQFFAISYDFPSSCQGLLHGERNQLPADLPEIILDEPVVFYDPAVPEVNAFYPMKTVKLTGSGD